MQNPNYYAILPANVRYDKRITPNAKLLYAEITALTNEKGYCWASNRYFADLYQVSTTSISKWISSLIEFGYLESKIKYKDGTKEILNRYLSLVKDPIEEKLNTPIEEKLKENNTLLFNNKVNTKIDMNTFDFEWLKIWIVWLKYKKQIKKNYKTDVSEKTAFNKLKNISNNNKETALEIINQSIENDWTGFFELKNKTSNKSGILNFD